MAEPTGSDDRTFVSGKPDFLRRHRELSLLMSIHPKGMAAHAVVQRAGHSAPRAAVVLWNLSPDRSMIHVWWDPLSGCVRSGSREADPELQRRFQDSQLRTIGRTVDSH